MVKIHDHRWGRWHQDAPGLRHRWCSFKGCTAYVEEDKHPEIDDGEEALWYVAIRVAYFNWGVDQSWEDMQFLNLWSLSILRGR